MSVNPRNPFRERMARAHFDAVVRAYNVKHKDIIRSDGRRHMGNSIATFFWRGYDSAMPASAWDGPSKRMMAYVRFRAGQLVAAEEAKLEGGK